MSISFRQEDTAIERASHRRHGDRLTLVQGTIIHRAWRWSRKRAVLAERCADQTFDLEARRGGHSADDGIEAVRLEMLRHFGRLPERRSSASG